MLRSALSYDDIKNTALKHFLKTAIMTLAQIFTLCLRLAYFSDKWKMATIIMIPKPRKKQEKSSPYFAPHFNVKSIRKNNT